MFSLSLLSRNFGRISRRFCSSQAQQNFREISPTKRKTKPVPQSIQINFIRDGKAFPVSCNVGDSLYEAITKAEDLEVDGFGACEGTLSCSTCHVIFEQSLYDSLPEKPRDEEKDMLDLAASLSDTSRLGCQVCVSRAMEGARIEIPAVFNDIRSME